MRPGRTKTSTSLSTNTTQGKLKSIRRAPKGLGNVRDPTTQSQPSNQTKLRAGLANSHVFNHTLGGSRQLRASPPPPPPPNRPSDKHSIKTLVPSVAH